MHSRIIYIYIRKTQVLCRGLFTLAIWNLDLIFHISMTPMKMGSERDPMMMDIDVVFLVGKFSWDTHI